MSYLFDKDGKIVGHVHQTSGEYLAQVRRVGCKKWRSAGVAKTRGNAIAKAGKAMKSDDHRLRVLFRPTGENGKWYGPTIVFEGVRK